MDETGCEQTTLSRFERVVFGRRVWANYTSLIVHLLALWVLAAWTATPDPRKRLKAIEVTFTDPDDQQAGGGARVAGRADRFQEAYLPDQPRLIDSLSLAVAETAPFLEVSPPVANAQPRPDAAVALKAAVAAIAVTSSPQSAAAAGGAAADGAAARQAYSSRQGSARGRGVDRNGGSEASEAAVERGLAWLARHQAVDGSWRFDLSGCQCDGGCSFPGTVTSTTAATGIALLPFLGAGFTHEQGTYRETVTRGLYYLMSRMQLSARGGDLGEGTMYGHGVASLALAEALGMTGDRMLQPYVRDAVRFIETAQDLHGGGWRYLPGQAGDTTVTAWQLAALKSGTLAGIPVPSPTIDGVCRFLDRVQVRNGEGYGYLSPQDRPCTSAVGLLCRVYTTWPDQATVDRGLGRLAKPGPGSEDVYRNFYLSQALLLRDHPAWKRWNTRNRDQLVGRQARLGHEAGSWAFADSDTRPGGRLGHTALAVLTLEVYYRLLPIYGVAAAETGW